MKFNSEKHYLSILCKRGHEWKNTGMSLMRKSSKRCCFCHAEDAKKFYIANHEKILKEQKQYHLKNIEKREADAKKYRAENKEKLSAHAKQFYIDNIVMIKATNKRYRLENKTKKKEVDKKYHEKNRKKILELQKQFRLENKEKIIANREKNKKRVQAYYKKCAVDLHDSYIRGQIRNIKAKDITPGMIALKREIIQFQRLTKEINNVINCR